MSKNEEYEDVTYGNNKLVKSAKLEIGGSFRGKLLGMQESTKYPGKQNLLMEEADGTPFTVFTSGSLDFAVSKGQFEIGQTYRITRQENKTFTGKFGKSSATQFKIERLKSDGNVAAPGVNNAKPTGKVAGA